MVVAGGGRLPVVMNKNLELVIKAGINLLISNINTSFNRYV